MTLAQLRARLRILIDSPHTAIWSDVNINDMLNDAYTDVINEIGQRYPKYYTKTGTVATVANNPFTALPSDCTTLNKLVDANGVPIVYTDSTKFALVDVGTGTPAGFDVAGRNIWWYPTPTAVASYTAYYHYLPASLSSDSSVPELPPNFHDIVCYGAAIKTRLAKEESLREYAEAYNSKLAMLLHQINIAQTNSPHRVPFMTGNMGAD